MTVKVYYALYANVFRSSARKLERRSAS